MNHWINYYARLMHLLLIKFLPGDQDHSFKNKV